MALKGITMCDLSKIARMKSQYNQNRSDYPKLKF